MARDKILLICNDSYYLEICANKLEQAGFDNVLEVMDKAEVFQVISTENPNLILLHHKIIAENDYSLLITLKEQQIAIPLIILNVSFEHSYDLSRFIQAGVYDYLPARINSEELTVAIKQALSVENGVIAHSPPIIEKVLTRLRELELSNGKIYAHLINSDHYRIFQPGDFVYFIENSSLGKKWMAFCCINRVAKDKSNPKSTQYFLEIIKQPVEDELFKPLNTLRKHFMVSRTPESSGIMGMWRFYTPREYKEYYSHRQVKMETWAEYLKPRIVGLVIIFGISLLVVSGCWFLVGLFL